MWILTSVSAVIKGAGKIFLWGRLGWEWTLMGMGDNRYIGSFVFPLLSAYLVFFLLVHSITAQVCWLCIWYDKTQRLYCDLCSCCNVCIWKVKVKVLTLDIAPLRSEPPPQKRSGMARVVKGFHSFTCTPTRLSAIGMSHRYLCLPSRSWYSFTNSGGMEGWVDLGAK